jgi:hypothetical protein
MNLEDMFDESLQSAKYIYLIRNTLKSVPNGRLKKVSNEVNGLGLTGTDTTDPAVLGWPAHITIT